MFRKIVLTLLCVLAFSPCALAQFRLEEMETGVRVMLDGKLFTQYLTAEPCPILWPLLAPDGTKMTRDFPMSNETPDEKKDHAHHRSMWFTHGEVNGIDFWHKGGKVIHQEFTRVESGPSAVIECSSLWVANSGEKLLRENRRMTFGANSETRWVDISLVLIAEFGDVHFGDTKEGTFAVRVAETMKVDKGKGGKIVNSDGKSNLLAWGQPASWVSYTGPVGEKTYGISMFCHPSSFNFPHRWHVRTYGLFAANPFGLKSFDNSAESADGVRLKQSEKLQLCYRILLHEGILDSQSLDSVFQEYAATKCE